MIGHCSGFSLDHSSESDKPAGVRSYGSVMSGKWSLIIRKWSWWIVYHIVYVLKVSDLNKVWFLHVLKSPWLLTYCQTFVSNLSWIRCISSLSIFVDMGGNGCWGMGNMGLFYVLFWILLMTVSKTLVKHKVVAL